MVSARVDGNVSWAMRSTLADMISERCPRKLEEFRSYRFHLTAVGHTSDDTSQKVLAVVENNVVAFLQDKRLSDVKTILCHLH